MLPTACRRRVWEDAAVVGMLSRRRAGGARPSPGVEQEALSAAMQRAPLLRRVITRGLLML